MEIWVVGKVGASDGDAGGTAENSRVIILAGVKR